MEQISNVKLIMDDQELPMEVLVDALYEKMSTDINEEDLETYAVGTKAGYLFLHKLVEEMPEFNALVTLQPAIANHLVSLFMAGMLAKKALDNEENNITIELHTIKESDAEDASKSDDSVDLEEGSTDSATDCGGPADCRTSEDERGKKS